MKFIGNVLLDPQNDPHIAKTTMISNVFLRFRVRWKHKMNWNSSILACFSWNKLKFRRVSMLFHAIWSPWACPTLLGWPIETSLFTRFYNVFCIFQFISWFSGDPKPVLTRNYTVLEISEWILTPKCTFLN